jgi:CBS domain-containing protein/sporulation protein YlmC with PRC-barrel domain
MPSLTELLDKPIRDPNGDAIASLHDLVVRITPPEEAPGLSVGARDVFPPVTGLVARLRGPFGARDIYIPWEHVASMTRDGVQLATPAASLERFTQRPNEMVLRQGLWDKQVVDVEGRRVVRINDLDLAQRDGTWRVVGVDVSPGALLRRMGAKRLSKYVPRGPLISWKQVVPVPTGVGADGGTLRLRVPRERLELLSALELARLVEQLPPQQGADLLEDLDEARAADALEELEDEQQGQILRAMEPERAADVLEEMDPDEAADALQNVGETEAADILGRMEREERDEVQELLGYPEDSAGGIMTTDYVSVPEWASAGAVVDALRAQARAAAADEEEDPLPEALSEVFVVAEAQPMARPPVPSRPNAARGRNGSRPKPTTPPVSQPSRPLSLYTEGRLVGIVTLRDLLLADPRAPIMSIMRPPRHVGHPLDNEHAVARTIADDDLLALPIVDEQGLLLGIVTVDDAIDVILPTAWKKRLPRLFH